MARSAQTILTVGHSTHPFEEFADLLRGAEGSVHANPADPV